MKNRVMFLQALFLVALVFVIYWPCYFGGFIWDDWTAVIHSIVIRAPDGLQRIWLTKQADDYWPVTYTVFWFAYRMWEENPLGYHLLNIAVHCGNALIIWAILRRLNFRHSYFAALIFAVHPVSVECVAWIFQLKTTMSVLFSWISTWFWISYVESRAKKYLAWSLSFFLLAMLSKIAIVTLPVILAGFVWFKNRRFEKKDLLALSPFFLLSLIFGLLNVFFWYAKPEQPIYLGFFERILNAARVYRFYLGKTIFPVNLSFVYPKWTIDLADPQAYLPLLSGLLLVGLLFWYRKKDSKPLASIGFTLAALFPALGFSMIYFMRYSYVSDHWQYWALIGNIVLVMSLLESLEQKVSSKVVTGILSLIVVIFSWLTFQQADVYQSEAHMWSETIHVNPKAWLAYNNLAGSLMSQGKYDQALENYKQVIAIDPKSFEAYSNIGIIYMLHGQNEEAKNYFAKSLEQNPNYANAMENLGTLLIRENHLLEAYPYYFKATLSAPSEFKSASFQNLGELYLQLGCPDKAMKAFEQSAQFVPNIEALSKDVQKAQKALAQPNLHCQLTEK